MKIEFIEHIPVLTNVVNNSLDIESIGLTADIEGEIVTIHIPTVVVSHKWPDYDDVLKNAIAHSIELRRLIMQNRNESNLFRVGSSSKSFLFNGCL
jgi:hypothetical protein